MSDRPLPEIDALPPLREIIAAHGLNALKALGQNFLLDLNLTAKIARQAGDLNGLTVIEIGPGPGGLTRSLLQSGAERVVAVEFDDRAVAALQGLSAAAAGRLTIVRADALKTDLLTLTPDADGKRAIVANLPYNIATPLLTGWLQQIRDRGETDAYRSMTLMFQREVVDRMLAAPGSKAYGRLSILTQWLCRGHRAMDIPPSAFLPPPKVTSSVVHLVPRALPPGSPSVRAVETLTQAAFSQRRKMIKSSLKHWMPAIERCGIDPHARPEDLPVETFIALAAATPS